MRGCPSQRPHTYRQLSRPPELQGSSSRSNRLQSEPTIQRVPWSPRREENIRRPDNRRLDNRRLDNRRLDNRRQWLHLGTLERELVDNRQDYRKGLSRLIPPQDASYFIAAILLASDRDHLLLYVEAAYLSGAHCSRSQPY